MGPVEERLSLQKGYYVLMGGGQTIVPTYEGYRPIVLKNSSIVLKNPCRTIKTFFQKLVPGKYCMAYSMKKDRFCWPKLLVLRKMRYIFIYFFQVFSC